MLKQKGKAKAHLQVANLPLSKSRQSKYHDLCQELKDSLPSSIQDWDDLTDEENKDIEEAKFKYGKEYIDTHPEKDNEISVLDCAICHMTGYLLSLCCHRPVLPAFVDISHIQVS